MAGWHLDALFRALTQRGWELVATHPGDGYRVSGSWEIRRSTQAAPVFVDFRGFDDMRCLPLEESYGCRRRGEQGVSLCFRRKGHLWQQELAGFVAAIDESQQSRPGVDRLNPPERNP